MEEYGLSDVLIEEILSRLPAKSLTRFKCVSKTWYSIITSSYFEKLYLKRLAKQNYPENNGLFIVNPTSTYTSNVESILNCDQLTDHRIPNDIVINHNNSTTFENLSISESCNGWLCLRYRSTSRCTSYYITRDNWFVLYNPATRAFKRLPALPIPTNLRGKLTIHLVLSGYFGFGYDHISDDYKVITVRNVINVNCYAQKQYNRMYIYSLRNNSWLEIEKFPHCLHMRIGHQKRTHGALANNALHWISYCGNKIIGIDLHNGEWRELPLPRVDEAVRLMNLDGYSGCLSLTVERRIDEVFEIWRMNKYGEKDSWMRYQSVKISDMSSKFIHYISPIAVATHNRRLFVAFVGEPDIELKLFYQTPDQSVFEVQLNDNSDFYYKYMIPFMPSVSFKSMIGN